MGLTDARRTLLDCGIREIQLKGTTYALDANKKVGRGGSCLVYYALAKDAHRQNCDRKVILKEFYPLYPGCEIFRQEDGSLKFLESKAIAGKRTRFETSYERFVSLFNDGLDLNTVQVHKLIDLKEKGLYMVVDYSSGITMETFLEENHDLYDFFLLMKDLASVLGKLHEMGCIHMDLKPGNILCPRKDIARLLDLDSVVEKKEISEDMKGISLSGSVGYTAPEVISLARVMDDPSVRLPYLERFAQNGERADMYSFGAMVYQFVFGNVPRAFDEVTYLEEDQLKKALQKKCFHIPNGAVIRVWNLLKKTMDKNPGQRYENMAQIEGEIDGLLPLVSPKEVRPADNFQWQAGKIIGREHQVDQLRKMLDAQTGASRVVCISGIGGVGKSALARYYGKIHRENYDIIQEVSASAVDAAKCSAEQTLANLRFSHWEPEGTTQQRCDAVVQMLYSLKRRFKTLLIVHDYDTGSDDRMGLWGELGCDVILTSRSDWRQSEIPTLLLSCGDLTEDAAREMFVYYYLQNAGEGEKTALEQLLSKEAEALRQLLKLLNHHPLGIKLMARQMAFVPGDPVWPSQALENLKAEGLEEDSLAEFQNQKESATLTENAYGHLAAIYHSAFANSRLRSEDRDALRYMTLVVPNMGISVKRFAKWTGMKSHFLPRLQKMGWLEYLPQQEDLLDDTEGRGEYVSEWPEDSEKMKEGASGKGTYVMPLVIQEVLRREPELACTVENCHLFVLNAIGSDGANGFTAVRAALREQRELLLQLLPEECSEDYAYLLVLTVESMAMGSMERKENNLPELLSLYQKSLDMMKVLPDTYDYQQLCYAGMIRCHAHLGNFEAAFALAEESAKLRESCGQDADGYQFYQMKTLYNLEFRAGKMKQAIGHMGRLLETSMENRQKDSYMVACIGAELGQMLRAAGCWKEAEQMLVAADKRFIQLFSSEYGKLSIELHNLMLVERGLLCLESLESSLEAQQLLYSALELSEEFMQPTDLRVGNIHFHLAECWAKGNPHIRTTAFEEAAEHRKQALEIYRKQLPPGAYRTVLTKLLLALDYGEIPGREVERDALLRECDPELYVDAPGFIKGDPCGNLMQIMLVNAKNAETEKRIPTMFEFLEDRRKLYLRLHGADETYIRECGELVKLCKHYDLHEKAKHYRIQAMKDYISGEQKGGK